MDLPANATEEDYIRTLALLGLLNSSTVCFWMKQVMNCKGLGGQGGGIKPEHWSRAYEFAGTAMGDCPIPGNVAKLVPLAKRIDSLAGQAAALRPSSDRVNQVLDRLNTLAQDRTQCEHLIGQMVALQEELDWQVYSLFGFSEYKPAPEPVLQTGISPDARPVEVLHKRQISQGEPSIFYEVHAYRGTASENKAHNHAYEAVADERIKKIESDSTVALLEQLDFKRRWQVEPWGIQLARASAAGFSTVSNPTSTSTAA